MQPCDKLKIKRPRRSPSSVDGTSVDGLGDQQNSEQVTAPSTAQGRSLERAEAAAPWLCATTKSARTVTSCDALTSIIDGTVGGGENSTSIVTAPAGLAGEALTASSSPARLTQLEIKDFKHFDRFEMSFVAHRAVCVIGQNACGKSSLADAILFVLLRKEFPNLEHLIHKVEPPLLSSTKAAVTAHFDAESLGQVTLRREALEEDDCFSDAFWVSRGKEAFRSCPEAEYRWWILRALKLGENDLLLPQFSLLNSCRLSNLLKSLSGVLDAPPTETKSSAPVPLLKRRRKETPAEPGQAVVEGSVATSSSNASGGIGAVALREAALARRLDEVYRELSRQPLDKDMQVWGEGGQALLRRSSDGSFTVVVSRKRGAASAGFGVQMSELSDGDQDVLALSLMLVMPRMVPGAAVREEPPAFVLLDEPDARLDQRHARALWRFLSGPLGPKQTVVLSLNNHRGIEPESGYGLIELE